MSAENGDLNWTEILRQASGPQNLSPIAAAQVFLLSAMLREERKRMETSNGSNGAINLKAGMAGIETAQTTQHQTIPIAPQWTFRVRTH